MKVRVAYGREGMWVDLPDHYEAAVIEPRFVAGLPDEAAAIRAALRAPIDSPPLRELVGPEDTVAIVFTDITRPMPNDRALPPLLAELEEAGVPAGQIVLINALGTHRVQTDAELRVMLGDAIVDRYRVVQHNAWDQENLVGVGVNTHTGREARVNRAYMECSVRILTGFIEPHLFAGYSGGYKLVLPGVADIETILDHHSAPMIAHPKVTYAITDGNPFWEEIQKVGSATAPTFNFNVTVNSKREITGVFAGGVVASQQAGIEFVRQNAMQPVPQQYDIVLTSNSGYPLDQNLYQAIKGISTAAQITRPGGHIIIATECSDGIPAHGEYGKLLGSSSSPQELLDRIMTPGFRCHDQWTVQADAQAMVKFHIHVFSQCLTDEELRSALVEPCRCIEDTIEQLRVENPNASLAVLPEGPMTLPYVAD